MCLSVCYCRVSWLVDARTKACGVMNDFIVNVFCDINMNNLCLSCCFFVLVLCVVCIVTLKLNPTPVCEICDRLCDILNRSDRLLF